MDRETGPRAVDWSPMVRRSSGFHVGSVRIDCTGLICTCWDYGSLKYISFPVLFLPLTGHVTWWYHVLRF